MSKTRSLRLVKSEAQVCEIPRDHYRFQNWSIMTNGHQVWISKQRVGEQRTDHIEIPKGIFDRLLALYEKPQPVKSGAQ